MVRAGIAASACKPMRALQAPTKTAGTARPMHFSSPYLATLPRASLHQPLDRRRSKRRSGSGLECRPDGERSFGPAPPSGRDRVHCKFPMREILIVVALAVLA